MRKRTQARIYALQLLYQAEIVNSPVEEIINNFWQNLVEKKVDEKIKEFAEFLLRGTLDKLSQIDTLISQYSYNWTLERMALVDKNILRLANFELIFCPQTPPKVAINEAVELAKMFSGQESAKFVNGILDKIKQQMNK